jgi:hypothetical protein
MGPEEAPLLLHVVEMSDEDAEELAEVTAFLQADLLTLDVASVDPLSEAEAPETSKGAAAAIGGWLAVHLGPTALRTILARVSMWASKSNRTVEVSLGGDILKVTGVSREQQDRLVDEWIARHTPVP